MEVTVNITEKDTIALNDHLSRTLPAIRNQNLKMWLGVPVLFVMLGVGLQVLAGDPIGVSFEFWFASIWLVGFPVFMKWLRRRTLRRLVRSSRNLDRYGEFRIVLTPTEIARYGKYGHTATYWPAVERVDVGPEHAFVFVGALNAFMIPKRDFTTEAAFDLFVETARKYQRDAHRDDLSSAGQAPA